jgi:hypothetical protein
MISLEAIHNSPYAQLKYSEIAKYPSSSPIGFDTPISSKGKIIKNVTIVSSTNDNGNEKKTSVIDVLETVDGSNSNNNDDNNTACYGLPGGLLHTTLCGEIRLCPVLIRRKVEAEAEEQDNEDHSENNNSNSNSNNNNNSVISTPATDKTYHRYRFIQTNQKVAIKMDQRTTMRKLHNDENQNHTHNPFPENPWKEVSALQFIQKQQQQQQQQQEENNTNNNNNHIIQLIDVLHTKECLYEILPYYPNTLYWAIQRERGQSGIDESIARTYFIQLLRAIHVLHSNGICHRDISSQNILLLDDEHDKNITLIDLGMCLRVPYNFPDDHYTEDVTTFSLTTQRRLIHSQSHCGKLRFMAPEMYNCQDFDGLAVDLWSAAVVLFEMVTGKLPYSKPCEQDSGYHDLMDESYYWNSHKVNQIYSWGHQVSIELVDLLKNMFRPNPEDRITLSEIVTHPWIVKEQ